MNKPVLPGVHVWEDVGVRGMEEGTGLIHAHFGAQISTVGTGAVNIRIQAACRKRLSKGSL